MSNDGIVIYKLKNGRTPNTYAIRQYNVMIESEKGYREIGYYPGASSIFADDNKKRVKEGIVFEFNNVDATEFVASKNNIVLNKYLQSHPDFNKDFEIFSKELQNQKELDRFERIELALEKINESDKVKVKAMALAIYGMDAYGISDVAANAMLKKTAISEPDVILLKMEHQNYEYQFLSAHAFYAGVVKENQHNNAVIWNDETMGTILHLATGETGIYKLAETLATNDAEARKITQTIGERLMKQSELADSKEKIVYVEKPSTEKDDQIAELQRQLEEMKKGNANAAPLNVSSPEVLGNNLGTDTKKEKVEEVDLAKLQEAYRTKFGKELPPAFKNQVAWIQSKLAEPAE